MEAQKPFHLSLFRQMFQSPRQHLHITFSCPEWLASFAALVFILTQSRNIHVHSYSEIPTISSSLSPYLDLIKSWLSRTERLGKRERGKYCFKNKRPFSKSSYQPNADTHSHKCTHMSTRRNGQFPGPQTLCVQKLSPLITTVYVHE